MWPRAFLDDPGAADDDGAGMDAAYGDGGNKSKRKGQAGIQVRFFELSRDGAKLRMEYRRDDTTSEHKFDPTSTINVRIETIEELSKKVEGN